MFFDTATSMKIFLIGKETTHICKNCIYPEFLYSVLWMARLEGHLECKLVRILSRPTTNPNKTNLSKKKVFSKGQIRHEEITEGIRETLKTLCPGVRDLMPSGLSSLSRSVLFACLLLHTGLLSSCGEDGSYASSICILLAP